MFVNWTAKNLSSALDIASTCFWKPSAWANICCLILAASPSAWATNLFLIWAASASASITFFWRSPSASIFFRSLSCSAIAISLLFLRSSISLWTSCSCVPTWFWTSNSFILDSLSASAFAIRAFRYSIACLVASMFFFSSGSRIFTSLISMDSMTTPQSAVSSWSSLLTCSIISRRSLIIFSKGILAQVVLMIASAAFFNIFST